MSDPTEGPEANEADVFESRQRSDGSLVEEELPDALGDRLAEASEADLLESGLEVANLEIEEDDELARAVPEADRFEQYQLPSDEEP